MGLQLQNEGIFTHFSTIVGPLGDDKLRPYNWKIILVTFKRINRRPFWFMAYDVILWRPHSYPRSTTKTKIKARPLRYNPYLWLHQNGFLLVNFGKPLTMDLNKNKLPKKTTNTGTITKKGTGGVIKKFKKTLRLDCLNDSEPPI